MAVRPPKGHWLRPVPSPLGTRFGVAGPMWASGHHTGQDFLAPSGTPVSACADGRVIWAGNTFGPYGIQVKLRHAPGLETWYCHLSSVAVRPLQRVDAGELLGHTGATGNVTGPHLHLEVRVNGMPVDPLPYLGTKDGHARKPKNTPTTAGGSSPTDNPGLAADPSSSSGVQDVGLLSSVIDPAALRNLTMHGLFLAAGFGLVAVGLAAAVRPQLERAASEATDIATTVAAPEAKAATAAAGATGAAAVKKG